MSTRAEIGEFADQQVCGILTHVISDLINKSVAKATGTSAVSLFLFCFIKETAFHTKLLKRKLTICNHN